MDDVHLRRGLLDDATQIADVWLRSFQAAMPTVRRAHTDEEVRAWIHDVLVPQTEVWVAEGDLTVLGVLALSEGWVDQLYVDPDWQGRGIGDGLIALAKSQQPSQLQLWTFQVNQQAQRFYQRRGFLAVEWTDGSGNEEREPDVRYVWHSLSV